MSDYDGIVDNLVRALGPSRVLTAESAQPYAAGRTDPVAVVIPENREEAAEIIKIAAAGKAGIVPCGGATKLSRPPAPNRAVISLSTERLRRIVQHEPRDLTVTIEPGIVLDDLNARLRDHRQRLSLDPPQADRATVGGICATNESGPLRPRYGTPRDLVLGMETIGCDGVATRSGARVVKSVAGFDMHRLHIGAIGSLGLISEMTFRLHPVPEAFRLAVVTCEDGDQAEECIASIVSGRTWAAVLELLTPFGNEGMDGALGEIAGIAPDAWTIVVGYEDCREAVDWQLDFVKSNLPAEVKILDDQATAAVYEAIREWPGVRKGRNNDRQVEPLLFKATMKSSEVVAFHAWAGQRGFRLLSHAANGVVYGRSDDVDAVEATEDLAAAAADGGGQLTWLALPDDANVPVWAPTRGDLFLMKRIKQTFDPEGMFSPGRFVDAM